MTDKQYIDYARIPKSLVTVPQWVCWQYTARDGAKQGKKPIDPTTGEPADVSAPDSGTVLPNTLHHHEEGYPIGNRDVSNVDTDGIGFIFTTEDPFVGVDLDNCVNSEKDLKPWARDIVETLDTYVEYSPSGTGLHCLCKGTLPEGNVRDGNIELYEDSRYFTITGKSVPQFDSLNVIVDCSSELATVCDSYIETDDLNDGHPSETAAAQFRLSTGGGNDLSDDEVLTKAQGARNSDKFERLWTGSTAGYESHSEADNALCAMLAFWTGGDAEQIDRLFRQSGLYRDKWDESRGNQTYGELTIEAALEQTSDYHK